MNANEPIKTIMTKRLVTVSPDTDAQTIRDIFNDNDFHHLPVVDAGQVLVGIISREDFFKVNYILSLGQTGRVWSEREYQRLRAADFMTKYPLVLDPEDTIGLAADIFLANQFHALPIVDDNALVGIVTTHDLLKYGFGARTLINDHSTLHARH